MLEWLLGWMIWFASVAVHGFAAVGALGALQTAASELYRRALAYALYATNADPLKAAPLLFEVESPLADWVAEQTQSSLA